MLHARYDRFPRLAKATEAQQAMFRLALQAAEAGVSINRLVSSKLER